MSVTTWIAIALYLVKKVDVVDVDSISALVSAADMINHAVPELDEVQRSLDDLSSRGCLDVAGTSCALAPHAARLVDGVSLESGFGLGSKERARARIPT